MLHSGGHVFVPSLSPKNQEVWRTLCVCGDGPVGTVAREIGGYVARSWSYASITQAVADEITDEGSGPRITCGSLLDVCTCVLIRGHSPKTHKDSKMP